MVGSKVVPSSLNAGMHMQENGTGGTVDAGCILMLPELQSFSVPPTTLDVHRTDTRDRADTRA